MFTNKDKSTELINQFIIQEHDELKTMITKVEKMNIKGPTFDEYLDILSSELKKSMKNYEKR